MKNAYILSLVGLMVALTGCTSTQQPSHPATSIGSSCIKATDPDAYEMAAYLTGYDTSTPDKVIRNFIWAMRQKNFFLALAFVDIPEEKKAAVAEAMKAILDTETDNIFNQEKKDSSRDYAWFCSPDYRHFIYRDSATLAAGSTSVATLAAGSTSAPTNEATLFPTRKVNGQWKIVWPRDGK